MGDVWCGVMTFYDHVCRARGLSLEMLAQGLPVTAEHLRKPTEWLDWRTFAAMNERFELLTSAEESARAGLEVVESPLADPFRKLVDQAVGLQRVYRIVAKWAGPAWFPGVTWRLDVLEDDRLEFVIEIPQDRAGCAAWLRMMGGALRGAPALAGRPHAHVDAEISPHRARFLVTLPTAGTGERSRAASIEPDPAIELLAERDRELRRSEDAARLSQRFYRTLLDSVTELIVIVDAEGRLSYVNAASRAFGYEPDEVVGKPFDVFVHADDVVLLREVLRRALAVPGAELTVDARARTREGELRELELGGKSLLDDPVIRGVVIRGRDVTDRKRAERALRERERAHASVLGNLSGMAYRCRNDPAWTMELVTDGAAALTGYDASELRENRVVAYTDLIHPDDAGPLREKCQVNFELGRACSNEYRIRTKNGEERWVLDVARGVYDAGGALLAIEGFVTDVTARKRLEEQLTHSQRLDGIGRLAGGIAHDFNNLLGAMLGYAEMARRDLDPDDPRRSDIGEIERAVHRASELTQQLLAFARRQLIQPKVVDVNQLTRDIEKLLRRVLGEDIVLVTKLAGGLWPILADPGQIEQVLVNLAVNARDAMPHGGALTIETSNVELPDEQARALEGVVPGPHVVLRVSDTGSGLSAEAQAHLFEPFFTTKQGKGTGLGLATCYGIVRQAGGSIRVTSARGVGTSFDIFLPRTSRAPDAASVAPAPSRAAGGETVLVVEDHEMVRRVVARTLSGRGYRVLTAQDGKEALDVVLRHPEEIHLLLTDMIMPEMGGAELAERMMALRPGIRVIYVSGFTESMSVISDSLAPGTAFLAKPFSPDALAGRVRELLDTPLDMPD